MNIDKLKETTHLRTYVLTYWLTPQLAWPMQVILGTYLKTVVGARLPGRRGARTIG